MLQRDIIKTQQSRAAGNQKVAALDPYRNKLVLVDRNDASITNTMTINDFRPGQKEQGANLDSSSVMVQAESSKKMQPQETVEDGGTIPSIRHQEPEKWTPTRG